MPSTTIHALADGFAAVLPVNDEFE
jgi:hypothetical protein